MVFSSVVLQATSMLFLMSNNIIDIDIIRNVNIRSDIKVDAIKVELMFDFDVISDMPD